MDGKRVEIDSKFQLKKCVKLCDGDDDDRISQLPDEILIAILSLLPLKDAVKTSILSPRWINLWKHISSLDFDAEDLTLNKKIIASERKLRRLKWLRYQKWVNQVLQSHKGPILKEFKICFDFNRLARRSIRQWLGYAFARQVERLELDLSASMGCFGIPTSLIGYSFPEQLLTSSDGAFKSLKVLSLKYIDMNRRVIDFFLRNCPLLECLIIHGANTPKHSLRPRVINFFSLKLKHLDLWKCYRMESVKVSAPNLSSLSVTPRKGLLLVNVPMLVELSVACQLINWKYLRSAISCCTSQLEILTLFLQNNKMCVGTCSLLKLPKLKKLVVNYVAEEDDSLIGLTTLMRGSPYLEEFVLKLWWTCMTRSDREVKNTLRFPHNHIKVVKIFGYYCGTSDFELVNYFLENCVALEKVIIDPSFHAWYPKAPRSPATLVAHQSAESYAKSYAKEQLEGVVPPHIELVIL